MTVYIITLLFLILYSAFDLKYKEIPAWLLYIGIAVVFSSEVVLNNKCTFQYIAVNIAVYAIVFAMAKALGKWIGGADFDVIYMIYLAVGMRNIVLFMFAVSAICGVVMLIRRSERDKRLPLIPALTAGYVITIIMGGGVC